MCRALHVASIYPKLGTGLYLLDKPRRPPARTRTRGPYYGRVGVGRVGFRRSDMMLKHGISFLGYLDNGLGYYRFSYNGSNKSYVGVMARKGRRGSEWPHSRYETALSPDVSTRLPV